MNYEVQKKFLDRQRARFTAPIVACSLFVFESVRAPRHFPEKLFGVVLAAGLIWVAHYLPNYLGLDADPWRRLYWFSRARWAALLLLAITSLLAGAKFALLAILLAAILHLALLRPLLKLERYDLRSSNPGRLTFLAVIYAAADAALFWFAYHGGVSPLLLGELLVCFIFLFAVLVRPRHLLQPLLLAFAGAAISYFVTAAAAPELDRVFVPASVFIWTFGAIFLLVMANQHNLSNYDDLLENLQAFLGETRESILKILLLSVPTLAENWRKAQPQGQEAVAAWYSANARLYLLANCQHHLLYRHILYTLGLLRVAKGRVLDYGGGNGDFSRALARAGADTTYLDVPGDAARYVKWRAEREGLPLKVVLDRNALEGPFDVIFCLDVVEHLVDLPPVFERFKQLLRPGGKLLATYYNGITSSAPMHIDPGYDAHDYLLAHGFRDIKSKVVGLFSPELMHKACFMILEREGS